MTSLNTLRGQMNCRSLVGFQPYSTLKLMVLLTIQHHWGRDRLCIVNPSKLPGVMRFVSRGKWLVWKKCQPGNETQKKLEIRQSKVYFSDKTGFARNATSWFFSETQICQAGFVIADALKNTWANLKCYTYAMKKGWSSQEKSNICDVLGI